MELVTTVRNFAHDMTIRHLAPDTHIRVIIDESTTLTRKADTSQNVQLPNITVKEQRILLNSLPHEENPSGSAELVQIIETSHVNTEPLEV
jgi:hypothetical protein